MENGTDLVKDNITQLRVLINRIKVDSQQSTSPLTMKLNGTLDAAVNGGVSKFEVLDSNFNCVTTLSMLAVRLHIKC